MSIFGQDTVTLGQLGPPELTSENDDLLPAQGVLCDQVRPAACGVGEDSCGQSGIGGSCPSLDGAEQQLAGAKDDFDLAVVDSKRVSEASSMIVWLGDAGNSPAEKGRMS